MAPQSGVNRLLVVGSSVTEGRPETIGGANVLMGKLLDHLNARPDIDFLFVKANRYPSAVRSLLSVLFKAWSSRSQWDLVFVNVSQRGLALLFPLLALLSALLGKKWAMRAFGADALEVLENTPWKGLLKWCVKRSVLVGMETHALVQDFSGYTQQTYWIPNVRDEVTDAFSVKKTYQRRFVFIAHVKRSKGIFDALRAFELLGAEYTFDFYVPIAEEACRKLETHPSYRGVLDPVDVPEVLTRYDGLVLPTFYQGEGYPGIVIEAYQAGLFCVATQWRSLPEIVEEGQSGFLLPVGDPEAIAHCIRSLDEKQFERMRTFIDGYRKKFDSQTVHRRLVDRLIKA